jgi:archaeal flagellin N-terminal-like domain
MRSKRGISSILGAVILVQIIIMSLLVVLSVEQQLGSSSQNLIKRLNYYSQNSPLSIIEINGNYYITSPNQQYICYIIYPNELKPIHEKISIPVSINSLLGGYPWAIIITNKGTWYNVTSLGIYSDTSNKLQQLWDFNVT